MPKIITTEEMARKAEIAKHYMSLPPLEKGKYAKSQGASRAAIAYWRKRYLEHPISESASRPRKKATKVTLLARRSYDVGHLEMSDGMRVLSVTVEDLNGVHRSQQVSVPAELKCGAIADTPLAQLALGCIDVLSQWGYKAPTTRMLCDHIKSLWR